jgi:1-acyl-sn-glycerol-3-phosphate acyltransferase
MLRNFLFNIFFYFGIILVFLLAIPALILPNKIILFLGKLLGHWSAFCIKFFLGNKINVIGKENIIKDENFFVACSHQSIFETFFLQTIINSPIFILKKELLKIPVFGWHLKKINSIAIDRNITTKENLGFLEKISHTVNKTKRPLIIFPQGTRILPNEKVSFKKGVGRIYEHLKIRCIPIALNSGNVWPKKGLKKTNSQITVSILKPIMPGIEKDLFIKELENIIYSEINKIN